MSGIVIQDDRFPGIMRKLPNAAGKLVRSTALNVRTYAIDSMGGAKHGRTYKGAAIRKSYSGKGRVGKAWIAAGATISATGRVGVTVGYRFHQASAPGEAPAIDTGALKNSGFVTMTGTMTAQTGFSAEYAADLEYGTRKLAARPILRPAAERGQKDFTQKVVNLEGDLR